jgi:hypothetical protein
MDAKNPLFSEIIRQDLPFDKALETKLKSKNFFPVPADPSIIVCVFSWVL